MSHKSGISVQGEAMRNLFIFTHSQRDNTMQIISGSECPGNRSLGAKNSAQNGRLTAKEKYNARYMKLVWRMHIGSRMPMRLAVAKKTISRLEIQHMMATHGIRVKLPNGMPIRSK